MSLKSSSLSPTDEPSQAPDANPPPTSEHQIPEKSKSLVEQPSGHSSGNTHENGKPSVDLAQEINWDQDDDNPHNWPLVRRTSMTILILVAMSPNLLFPASNLIIDSTIQDYFHVGHELSALAAAFNLFGVAIGGPFIWAPLSEFFGRRYILTLPTLAYLLLCVGLAIPTHQIGGYLLLRFFGGIFSVCSPTAAAGVLSDLWGPVARGNIMSFYLSAFIYGPALGPFLQAVLYNSYLGWKWFAWIVLIACAFGCTLLFLFYKETYGPILIHRKCVALRKQDPVKYGHLISPQDSKKITIHYFLDETVFRAFKMLFTEPTLISICVYEAVVYGMVYGLFSMISTIWEVNRGMSLIHTALMYFAVVSGSIFGAAIFPLCDPTYPRLAVKWRGVPPPELRLRTAIYIAPLIVPIVLFLGWTGNYSQVPWYVPLIALFLVSATFNMLLTTFFNYIADFYVKYSATAIGGINFARVGFAGIYPLFTTQMYNAIGTHWSSVIYAGVLLLLAPIPLVLYKYGPKLRMRSSYAPCLDLEIKDEVLAEGDKN